MSQTQASPPAMDRTADQRERRPDGTFAPSGAAIAARKRHAKVYTPAELTKRLRQVVTTRAIGDVMANMLRIACGGEGASHADQVQAAKLICDRVLGRPHQSMSVQHEQPAGSERVILQQIAVILDRQPDLRQLLTASDGAQVIDTRADTQPVVEPVDVGKDPPPPPSEEAAV